MHSSPTLFYPQFDLGAILVQYNSIFNLNVLQCIEIFASGIKCVQLNDFSEENLFKPPTLTHRTVQIISTRRFNTHVLHNSYQQLATHIHAHFTALLDSVSRLYTLSTVPITTTNYIKRRD